MRDAGILGQNSDVSQIKPRYKIFPHKAWRINSLTRPERPCISQNLARLCALFSAVLQSLDAPLCKPRIPLFL